VRGQESCTINQVS